MGGGTRTERQRDVLFFFFFCRRGGNVWKRRGIVPFPSGRSKHKPRGFPPGRPCGSRDKHPGPVRGQAGRTQRWRLLSLPVGLPQAWAWAASTKASGMAHALAQRLSGAPNDAAPRPRVRSRSPQWPSYHPVTGLRSVTTTAAALFLRLLADPPTFLTTNQQRGRPETALRRPAQTLSCRKAKLLFENQ